MDKISKKLYKGMTDNLERRFKEHCAGKTKTTKNMDNLVIVYTEQFETRAEARAREIYFKSAAGRRFLKNKINKDD
jgi:putative endonuclease